MRIMKRVISISINCVGVGLVMMLIAVHVINGCNAGGTTETETSGSSKVIEGDGEAADESTTWTGWAKDKISEGLGFKEDHNQNNIVDDAAKKSKDKVTDAAAKKSKDKVTDAAAAGGEYVSEKSGDVKKATGEAKEKASEAKRKTAEKAEEAYDKTADKATDTKEAAKAGMEKTEEKAQEHMSWAKQGYEAAKDKAARTYDSAKDTISENIEAAKLIKDDVLTTTHDNDEL
ncbi:hypothetical protein ABFS83_07G000300 [Erythranthe nasuta]